MPDPSPIQDNPLGQFSLSGRVFVITGASSGIGREITRFLAGAGAAVVGTARRQDKLDNVIEQITESGGRAKSVCADLADRPGIGDVAAQCKDAFGRVDGVVNAAGINLRQSADEITIEGWDATLNLNLCVPFFFSREFIPGMVENRFGRIINIASLQSFRAFADSMAYGASKGGICQLTRAMAQAWSPQGITCNAIAPGFFPTELTAPVFDDPEMEQWRASQTMLGRNGKLSDLSGITVFFASAASAYITGQTLHIDGGFSAR